MARTKSSKRERKSLVKNPWLGQLPDWRSLPPVTQQVLTSINQSLRSYGVVYDFVDNTLGEKIRRERIGDSEHRTFAHLTDAFFQLSTGETRDFEAFYDSFDAPGTAKGDRPVAWNDTFVPDIIRDTILSDGGVQDKYEKVVGRYKECMLLELAFREAQRMKSGT